MLIKKSLQGKELWGHCLPLCKQRKSKTESYLGLCHYGLRYGVRLYGTVRKYGVQPYFNDVRPYIR